MVRMISARNDDVKDMGRHSRQTDCELVTNYRRCLSTGMLPQMARLLSLYKSCQPHDPLDARGISLKGNILDPSCS